ncbi:odorant receptor 49a-like [Cimex lectularius]|uniref:Odorant receptor n=1 Tax=Cimex lectularius TaxID=79782 RepID=A0A8I6S9H8_CIMLE|nr:odorant receptor 49a-like [Cimex lectularius]
MESTEIDAFKILKRYLKAYGVNKTSGNNVLKKIHFFLVVLICLIGLFGFGRGAIYANQELSDRCITIVTTFCSGFAAVKITYLYWNIDDLNLLMDSLKSYNPDTFVTKAIRKLLTSYSLMMSGMILLWVCTPLVFLQRRIPMYFSAPWESESWLGFITEYILASVCLLCEAHIHTMMDSFVMLLSLQISHRLYLLRLSLEHIGSSGKSEMEGMEGTIYKSNPLTTIQLCVDEHVFIRRLMKAYEGLVSVVFLFQVLISTVIIGIVIFSVTTLEKTVNEIIKYVPIFGLVYSQIFLYCWSGENISTHYNNLSFACYSSKWYQLPVTHRKQILKFQLNSTKPVKIRGWYITDMALSTFLASVQQSCSYFMILYQFVLEK